MKTLEYYFVKKGVLEHVIFNKYTIDNGSIKNKKTGKLMSYANNNSEYNTCCVIDDSGRIHNIRVARAIASSILGSPPSPDHTADHVDRNSKNDTDGNIRWMCKAGQVSNRKMPSIKKDAFVVCKDGVEKTINEWVVYLKDENNKLGREYTGKMITKYAHQKQKGFSYKEYPDLHGEVWKDIVDSKNWKGCWRISNMNRVKYITKHAENVLSGERLGLKSGYPTIAHGQCHILAFAAFFPEEYANKKPGELVLHEDDDRLDFRPHKLRLGTRRDNIIDAYDNGKYDGVKTARMRCLSYIKDVLEKEHNSQHDAMRYLKTVGCYKATVGKISQAISGDRKTAYGRTWKKI